MTKKKRKSFLQKTLLLVMTCLCMTGCKNYSAENYIRETIREGKDELGCYWLNIFFWAEGTDKWKCSVLYFHDGQTYFDLDKMHTIQRKYNVTLKRMGGLIKETTGKEHTRINMRYLFNDMNVEDWRILDKYTQPKFPSELLKKIIAEIGLNDE